MQVFRLVYQRANYGIMVLVGLFFLLLPIANPRVYATDEVQYYVYLRSLRFDGDLNFANDYQELARRNPRSGIDGSLLQSNRIRPKTGLYGNIAPVGSAIMWAPFFLAADAGVQLANLFGANIPADGYSRPYILSVCYASALYGLLGLLLCQRLATQYASAKAALAASLAIWLASPLVFYMFVQMPFAHATGFFLVSVFLTIWHSTRTTGVDGAVPLRSWRSWLLLGLVAGLMTMTREQLGLFVLLPVVEAITHYWQQLRYQGWRTLWPLAARHILFGVAFVVALMPQFAAYQILNGEMRPAGEVSGRINWCSPHLIDTLIDYNPAPSSWCNTVGDFTARFPPFSRGAFVWSPLLAPAIIGLVLLWRRDRLLTIGLLVVFIAQCYINGAYGTTWHLRGAFGFRRLIECTPLFILGLALVLDRIAMHLHWRWLALLLGVFVLWNAGLILNGTFFEAETNMRKIGLIWPETWWWQAEVIGKVARQLESILFERCRFLQNSTC
jgi:hypothetical protein